MAYEYIITPNKDKNFDVPQLREKLTSFSYVDCESESYCIIFGSKENQTEINTYTGKRENKFADLVGCIDLQSDKIIFSDPGHIPEITSVIRSFLIWLSTHYRVLIKDEFENPVSLQSLLKD